MAQQPESGQIDGSTPSQSEQHGKSERNGGTQALGGGESRGVAPHAFAPEATGDPWDVCTTCLCYRERHAAPSTTPEWIIAAEWDDLAEEFDAMASKAEDEARRWQSRAAHARQQARMLRKAEGG